MKIRILIFIAILLFAGCQSLDQQKQLQTITRIALNHAGYEQALALKECGQALECKKAERIEQYIQLGKRFDAYLDEPMPIGGPQMCLGVADLLLEQMQAEGASERMILYVQDIRVLLELMIEKEK